MFCIRCFAGTSLYGVIRSVHTWFADVARSSTPVVQGEETSATGVSPRTLSGTIRPIAEHSTTLSNINCAVSVGGTRNPHEGQTVVGLGRTSEPGRGSSGGAPHHVRITTVGTSTPLCVECTTSAAARSPEKFRFSKLRLLYYRTVPTICRIDVGTYWINGSTATSGTGIIANNTRWKYTRHNVPQWCVQDLRYIECLCTLARPYFTSMVASRTG